MDSASRSPPPPSASETTNKPAGAVLLEATANASKPPFPSSVHLSLSLSGEIHDLPAPAESTDETFLARLALPPPHGLRYSPPLPSREDANQVARSAPSASSHPLSLHLQQHQVAASPPQHAAASSSHSPRFPASSPAPNRLANSRSSPFPSPAVTAPRPPSALLRPPSSASTATTATAGTVTTSPSHTMTIIAQATDHDVLSGRGVNVAHHPGNERFRALVNSVRDDRYCTEYSTSEKRAVARTIIDHIHTALDPPGRFLRRAPASMIWGPGGVGGGAGFPVGRASPGDDGLQGPWIELTMSEAVKKTCQALRDCNRQDRTGYAASVSVPDDVRENLERRTLSGLTLREQARKAAERARSEADQAVGEAMMRRPSPVVLTVPSPPASAAAAPPFVAIPTLEGAAASSSAPSRKRQRTARSGLSPRSRSPALLLPAPPASSESGLCDYSPSSQGKASHVTPNTGAQPAAPMSQYRPGDVAYNLPYHRGSLPVFLAPPSSVPMPAPPLAPLAAAFEAALHAHGQATYVNPHLAPPALAGQGDLCAAPTQVAYPPYYSEDRSSAMPIMAQHQPSSPHSPHASGSSSTSTASSFDAPSLLVHQYPYPHQPHHAPPFGSDDPLMDPLQLAATAGVAVDLHQHQHFYHPHPQLQQNQQVLEHHPSYLQSYLQSYLHHHPPPPAHHEGVDVNNDGVDLGGQDDSNEFRIFPAHFDPADGHRDDSNGNVQFPGEDHTSNQNPFLD